jgi:flagellar protein FliS
MATIAFLEPYSRSTSDASSGTDHGDLIQALILSALRKVDQARRAHETGQPVEKGFYIGRATSVVDALRDALDMDSGGQTARDFDRVYAHIDLCLQLAVHEEALEPLDRAREAVAHLAACWRAASCRSSVLKGTA